MDNKFGDDQYSGILSPSNTGGLTTMLQTLCHARPIIIIIIIIIIWLDSKHMNSYMVPHQLRGAQRERASI